jgi:CheY-like chemotaxis protein
MKTILIVDDLESVCFYHRHIFEVAGFRALIAHNGEDALQLLQQEPIDLVLLDLIMPQMGGADFLQRARLSDRAGLPVLVISSEVGRTAADDLGCGGPHEILKKPVLPDALLGAVRRLLA